MATDQLSDKEIFNFARRLDSREAVEEYLDQICGDDRERRQRILTLVEANKGDSFLEKAPVALPETVESRSSIEREGQVIGNYKLLQKIGEGGFGVVYMAEQTSPVRRQVALKIIKPGMDSKEVIARFEAERQALAMMDHPNIAKVFDGGQTESGHPFFVMELVKGVPLTKFCDENKLDTRERLRLFANVCNAIQHAHQKGVIHRDIKPSNVLVTLHDGKPVPKVIDFGVAKAISQQLTAKTLFTKYGQMVGTPQYMSPEQAEMSGLDIDTRSDIYSLGVLLYELLTGTTPIDPARLRQTGYAEMQRMICEEEPPRPSRRLSTLRDQSIKVASCRKSDIKSLSSLIRGEIDWIVMKALEKDRNRRYETARGFSLDIERYLQDEAVAACPPSTAYKLRKFARRNKAAMAMVGSVVLSLILGLGVALWWALKASEAKERALVAEKKAEERFEREQMHRLRAEGAEKLAERSLQKEVEIRRELERQRYADQINLGFEALRVGDLVRLDVLTKDAEALVPHSPFELRLLQALKNSLQPDAELFHSGIPVTSVDITDDSKLVAIGLSSGEIAVLDRIGGDFLSLERANPELRDTDYLRHRTAVRFADGGRFLAGACSLLDDGKIDNEVRVWETSNLQRVGSIKHDSAIVSLAISRDGQFGASTDLNGSVKLWSFPSGELIWHQKNGLPYGNSSAAFNATGSHLAFGGNDAKISIVNVADGALLYEGQATGPVQDIEYSPDSSVLAVATGLECRLWKTLETGLVPTNHVTDSMPWDIAFSPDGRKLAITGADAKVRVIDVSSWTDLGHFPIRHAGTCVVFDESRGSLLVSTLDGYANCWSADRLETGFIRGVAHFVLPLAVSDDSDVVTSSDIDNAVVIWKPVGKDDPINLYEHPTTVRCVAISSDNRYVVSGDASGRVILFDLIGHAELSSWQHNGEVASVCLSRDSSLVASAGYDGRVVIRYLANASEDLVQLEHDGFATAVAFSPDGRFLATAGGTYWSHGETKLWKLDGDVPRLYKQDAHPNVVVRLAFSPNGKMLAVTHDYIAGLIRVWDLPSFERRFDIKAHQGMCSAIDFSRDGERIVSGGDDDGTLRFWDSSTGTQLGAFEVRDQVRSVVFMPDDRGLVTASKSGIVRRHLAGAN